MSFAQSLTMAQSASRGAAPPANATGGKKVNARAWAAAQNFEASFLGAMFENMFTDIDGEGPFGGGQATGIWRSFLTQEYAKSFAKAGGIGLADPVYRALIAHQEASASTVQKPNAAAPRPQTSVPP
jgi:Rod binding domain-containing protein